MVKTKLNKSKLKKQKLTKLKSKFKKNKLTKMKQSHYNKKHCSPKKNKLSYSCLSHKTLINIAKALNKLPNIQINPKLSDKDLYQTICDTMKTKFNCNNEACWLNIRKLMNNLSYKDSENFKNYFRPHMPSNIVDDYTKWISNYDIEAVLNQYHKELPEVYSYGAVPIDFKNCSVSSDLCKINIKNHMDNNETKLIVVFNTDDSKGPGQHWNSMYVDLLGKNYNSQPGIYFFDSFAAKPMPQVKELIETIKKQGESINKEFIVGVNDKRFQENNFSCGFYCMHFLENMINNVPFKKYINSGLSDKKMIQYRNKCYLHPEEIKNIE